MSGPMVQGGAMHTVGGVNRPIPFTPRFGKKSRRNSRKNSRRKSRKSRKSSRKSRKSSRKSIKWNKRKFSKSTNRKRA